MRPCMEQFDDYICKVPIKGLPIVLISGFIQGRIA